MDPISVALGIAGLGLQLGGGILGAQGASAANSAAINQIQLESQAEGVRKQMLHTQIRRQQLEEVRKAQRMMALATNNAVTQGGGGAFQSSGIYGGRAQISGQTNTNQQTLNLSQSFGDQMFDLNQQISAQRIAQAQANQQIQFGSGLATLGKGLTGSIGAVHQLTGGWGSNPTNVGSATQMNS